jgi:hypothetical protein
MCIKLNNVMLLPLLLLLLLLLMMMTMIPLVQSRREVGASASVACIVPITPPAQARRLPLCISWWQGVAALTSHACQEAFLSALSRLTPAKPVQTQQCTLQVPSAPSSVTRDWEVWAET